MKKYFKRSEENAEYQHYIETKLVSSRSDKCTIQLKTYDLPQGNKNVVIHISSYNKLVSKTLVIKKHTKCTIKPINAQST